MYITPIVTPPMIPVPFNPTSEQRHQMLFNTLAKEGRSIDYENILSLLAPYPDITQFRNPGQFKNLKVAILGGGLAGMSAAFELRKLGYDITIFEPVTDRIGGRVYTYYFDEEKKLFGELGAMRIPVSHETTWHYIDLFGLNTERFISSDPNAFRYVRGIRIRDRPDNVTKYIYPEFDLTEVERNTPWPKLYNNMRRYYLSSLPPDIRKQFLMVLPKYDYRLEAIEGVSLRKAMKNYGLSDEAIDLIGGVMPTNGELMSHSYEVTIGDEYSLDFSNVYKISGGMVNLPLAFYNSLMSQSPKEYGNLPQDAIGTINWSGGNIAVGFSKSENDKQVILTIRSINEEDYRQVPFDYVISAVPFTALRPVTFDPQLSSRKMNAIREIYYEDAQKSLALCRERFWEKQGIRGGASYTDEVIGITNYPSDHANCWQNDVNCSPDEPGVLLATYNIGQDAKSSGNVLPNIRFSAIKRGLERLHGLPLRYLDNIILEIKTVDWTREPWFYGAFMMLRPGQKEDLLYVSTTPEYDNRVFFAGEHASSKNGWMQGALQSGMRAAHEVAYYSSLKSQK